MAALVRHHQRSQLHHVPWVRRLVLFMLLACHKFDHEVCFAFPTGVTSSTFQLHPPIGCQRTGRCNKSKRQYDYARQPMAPVATTTMLHNNIQEWEGDDLRWLTKFRRRLQRRPSRGDSTPAKNVVIALNIFLFLYQTVTTVNFIRQRHPSYWPSHGLSMIADAVVGSSLPGPLLRDFGFSPSTAQLQPHRYLTSGFFHGGIIHLLINLDTLRRQPSWLETGLGAPLYLTTFLSSIVAGNVGCAMGVNDDIFGQSFCLGSSGGICGLYGLLYASLIRMGNRGAASRIARGMAILFLSGFFVEGMSNTSHLGGFVCGLVMAVLFSPSYKKSYSLRRKNSVEYDPSPRDFRQAMGFGVMPSERGMIPLPLFWVVLGVLFALAKPKFRAIPALLFKGLLFPGSVSSS